MIAIIDYDIGNISAVSNMLHRLGIKSKITADKNDVERAEKIILPGNGAFDACIKKLQETGLIPVLEKKVLLEKTPLMGICVGAQLLGTESEEGHEKGLGWIKMKVKQFPPSLNIRVPHMGWNYVSRTQKDNPLTADFVDNETRFYFIHSYFMEPEQEESILLKSHYGMDFAAAICLGNIVGFQFHPEKSHRFGKQLLAKFAKDF